MKIIKQKNAKNGKVETILKINKNKKTWIIEKKSSIKYFFKIWKVKKSLNQ